MTSTGDLAGLAAISDRYDAVFCDIWGVLHDGATPFRRAADALEAFRSRGGIVVLITNAPLLSPVIVARLNRMGIGKAAFDAIVSSGDTTRSLLSAYRGRVVHVVGPPEVAAELIEGLDIAVGPAAEAHAVLVTDLDTDEDTPEMYVERVALWRERDLPMICANPDKVVEDGDRLIYCGGALGDLYEAAGGRVLMAGKPYGPIYEEALRLATEAAGRTLDRPRILAIGDSIRTDAMGAGAFGVDFLFVAGAIHGPDLTAAGGASAATVAELVTPSGARLAGFMQRLVP